MSTRNLQGDVQPQGMGEDPLLHLTKLFVKFLRSVFSTFEPGSYRWSNDEESTEIVITDQSPENAQVVDRAPMIVVSRGQANYVNLAMDQFKGFDQELGKRTHTDLIACSMTYSCLSVEGLEAQRIAWIAAHATRALKRSLLKAGLHRVGDDISIGPETPPGAIILKEPSGVIMVPVFVPFYAQQTWSVEPIDKRLLKEINVALRSEARYPADEEAVPIRAPGMNGKVLTYDRTISLNTKASARVYGTPKPR